MYNQEVAVIKEAEVTERVAMDWVLRCLPPEECKAVGMWSSGTSKEIVEALECALATPERVLPWPRP